MSKITTDFVRAIKKTYEEVGAILMHVKLVQEDVKALREQAAKNANQPCSNAQTNNSEQEPPLTVTANTTDTKRQEEERSNKTRTFFRQQCQRWWKQVKKPRFQIAVLTLFFLIAYTCETHRTNTLTQTAITDTETRARMEDRPYASLTPRYGAETYVNEKKRIITPGIKVGDDKFTLEFAVNLKIVGRSPAVELRSTPTVIIIDRPGEARQKAVNYVPEYTNLPTNSQMPDETITLGGEMPTVNAQQLDDISNSRLEIYLVGGVQYRDVFSPRLDHPYEVVYCFKLNPDGMPFSFCYNTKATRKNQD